MEKLDYLLYQLKLNGIFVNLNLHVSRTLTAADEIVDDPYMPTFNKGVDIFDPLMRERHKEYAKHLLLHVNQYTELAYYDDPVIAMVEVTNEDSLLGVWGGSEYDPDPPTMGRIDCLGSYYQDLLDTLWGNWWMENHGIEPPYNRPKRNEVRDGECDPGHAMEYIDFLLSLEEDYHQDMVNYLRNIDGQGVGVQVPISGTQSGALDATIKSSTFHDQHACYCCWDDEDRFFLDSITKYPFYYNEDKWMDHRPIPHISGGKVTGKPYVATELSSPWPNPHQAESILMAALYGAFQDWDGLVVFAYRGDRTWEGRDYVAMKYDFDRHMTKLVAITIASLLFRRNDINAGGAPLKLITTRKDVLGHAWNNQTIRFSEVTHALGTWVNGFDPPEGYLPGYATLMRRIEIDKGEEHISPQPPALPDDYIFRTDTNELEWHYDPENIDDSFVKVDTENVHVLAGAIDTGHVEIHNFSHGVLAGGSIEVDPHPPSESALIAMILVETTPACRTYLVIATGEMKNEGQNLEEVLPHPEPPNPWLYTVDECGSNRVLVEGIDAYIILPVSAGSVTFHCLNPDGSEGGLLQVDDLVNYCGLPLATSNQTLWYKVVVTL